MPDDDPKPFELEPEKAEPTPEPAPRPEKKPDGRVAPATYEERAAEQAERRLVAGADASEVDSRTVAERAGEEVPRGSEDVPMPADWPGEALAFPFRAPGPGFILMGVVVLLPLDLMLVSSAVAFVGWVLKLLLILFVLRAQLLVIGSSAAGHDVPLGWRKALVFERDDLGAYARTVLLFVLLIAPGCFVLAFGNVWLGMLLVAVGSMYAAVVALGAALQDRTIKRPWNAFGWIGRWPLYCVVGSLAWWLLVLTEWSLASSADQGLTLIAFLSVILRFAGFYALLLSARAIGVMGRAWSAA